MRMVVSQDYVFVSSSDKDVVFFELHVILSCLITVMKSETLPTTRADKRIRRLIEIK